MKAHKEQTKRMVKVLISEGKSVKEISERLNLSYGQVTHIKDYYYGDKKERMREYMKNRAEIVKASKGELKETGIKTTRKLKEVVVGSTPYDTSVDNILSTNNDPKVSLHKIINFGGLEIEIDSSMVKKIIITEQNKIKIL